VGVGIGALSSVWCLNGRRGRQYCSVST